MAICITGATGFIGGRLARRLATAGETVHALCRTTGDRSALRHPNIRVIDGDVTCAADVRRAIEGCERVYHLAAYARSWARDPATFHRVNVEALEHVLAAARATGVRRVVFTSTALTLGPSNGAPVDEHSRPAGGALTPYARSKVVAEARVAEAVGRGLDVVTVLPTRVFGPGVLTEANSATLLMRLYLRGMWRVLPGDGSRVGNWAFVDDVVAGLERAMALGRAGERYVLGGVNATYREFFTLLGAAAGRTRYLLPVARSLALAAGAFEEARAGVTGRPPLITREWVRVFFCDGAVSVAKAERELGYAVTPIGEALAHTVAWLRKPAIGMEPRQ